ncbi:MAG: hypothetical protein H6834_05565 [Planctomycetes bacterium]|nr:hypothetical protein [Planctomycetota bacterium]MCB9890866.1 hypothetical protein [Planctomycetota bacterium]
MKNVLCILLLAIGSAFAVWGIAILLTGDPFRPPIHFRGAPLIGNVSEALAWAAFFLVCGGLPLVGALRPGTLTAVFRVIAIVSIGLGVAFLVGGLVDKSANLGQSWLLLGGSTRGQIIGAGAGFLGAGVTALALSFLRRRGPTEY